MATQTTTKPCPADQAAPVSPTRSGLADVALAAGISADDVQAYVSSRYRYVRSDIGLMQVAR
jgi:hypothetical protein